MSDKIIIDYEAIDEAISELSAEKEKVNTIIKDIKKLSFYAGRKSKGPCAKRMEDITNGKLISVAQSVNLLIDSTSKFVNTAKEKVQETETTISNKY